MIVEEFSSIQRAIDVLLKPALVAGSAYFVANIDSGTESVILYGKKLTKNEFYGLQAFVASLLTTPITQYVFDNHMKHHPRFKEISKDIVEIGVHVAITVALAMQYVNKELMMPILIAILSEILGAYANRAVLPML